MAILTETDQEISVPTQSTMRLTVAQALTCYLSNQRVELMDGTIVPLFGGIWGIFGHGNMAGLGEALYQDQGKLPFFRGQNEQSMAFAAIAFAKAHKRKRVMGVTTSIGPGATNLTTPAALAHINRLPVLFLPGDSFATRRPDPVLQQLEDPHSPLATVNDTLRPVSKYFDRLTRPEQLLASLPQAILTLTDPLLCGPVTLALPQDLQTEAWDFPTSFFHPKTHYLRRPQPDKNELQRCANLIRHSKRPMIISGGGAIYSGASKTLASFCETHHIPFAETQAGKGILPWNHPFNLGGLGVNGTNAANRVAEQADLILSVGTRLSDFTTASKTLFQNPNLSTINLNLSSIDASKLNATSLVCDTQIGLTQLSQLLIGYQPAQTYTQQWKKWSSEWLETHNEVIHSFKGNTPTDAQVIHAVNEIASPEGSVVASAGGIPGELHKHWKTKIIGGYHVEYGYSTMGYEIPGGIGVKLASPQTEVYVMVGDGSYLMLHTELFTTLHYGIKLNVILLDNHGFGSIHRLQEESGSPAFGNLLSQPSVDFVASAKSYGCHAEKVTTLEELQESIVKNKGIPHTCVTVIETTPHESTSGIAWWDVAIAETSQEPSVYEARTDYLNKLSRAVHSFAT